MDLRKLIQHGNSSLTISLPSEWIKAHGLKKGDVIHLRPDGQQLIITTDQPLQIEKQSIDITDLDRTSALFYIQSLYRLGYNEIEVRFQNSQTLHHRKQEQLTTSSVVYDAVNRMIGMEVVEQSANRILIKQLTREASEDLQTTLRRAFLLAVETADTLQLAMLTRDTTLFASIDDRHDNTTKFIGYALRLLNKYGYPDSRKTALAYHCIALLDRVVDLLKHTARDLVKGPINFKKSEHIIKLIIENIHDYQTLFFNFDLKLVNKLSKDRHTVRTEVYKIKGDELFHIARLAQIPEILLDMTESSMSLK